ELAIRQVDADDELRQQRVLDAEEKLVGERSAEARVNGVRVEQSAVAGIDVGAEARGAGCEQGRIDRTAARARPLRAEEIRVAGRRQRVGPGCETRAELVGEPRVAGAQQGLALGAE